MRAEQFSALDFIDSGSADFSDAWNACPDAVETRPRTPRLFAIAQSPGALWLDDLDEARRPPPPAFDAPIRGGDDLPLAATLLAERKACRRAEVRRRRQPRAQGANDVAPITQQVLVLEPDTTCSDQLCDLLRSFGFDVHVTADPAEASARTAFHRFAGIFVDINAVAANGGDGIDLCKRVREVRPRLDAHAPVLVLVAAQLQPIDRVRADLAGCDETILGPISRGLVARVLDARGISLPSDERRV